jgi:hypothetical protein
MQLDQEVNPTDTVKFLPLPNEMPDPQEGTKCTVAGWGAVNASNFKMTDDLMSANVTVIKRETCNSPTYYNSDPVITANMVCAGTVGENEKDQDACRVIDLSFLSISCFGFGRLKEDLKSIPDFIFFSTGRLWRTFDVQRCASRSNCLWQGLRYTEQTRSVYLAFQRTH